MLRFATCPEKQGVLLLPQGHHYWQSINNPAGWRANLVFTGLCPSRSVFSPDTLSTSRWYSSSKPWRASLHKQVEITQRNGTVNKKKENEANLIWKLIVKTRASLRGNWNFCFANRGTHDSKNNRWNKTNSLPKKSKSVLVGWPSFRHADSESLSVSRL